MKIWTNWPSLWNLYYGEGSYKKWPGEIDLVWLFYNNSLPKLLSFIA